jgi:hypothetical protein
MVISASCAARFWSKVQKGTGCWLWTGGLNKPNGYGQIEVEGRHALTHRVAWQLAHPEQPVRSPLCVLHHCDNPQCVNPDHLFLGTHADNMHDMFDKERRVQPRGEGHGMSKLTDADVLLIRSRHMQRISAHRLSLEFGVVRSTVQRIVRRDTWTHI